MRMKGCPLLVQSDTNQSMMIEGESYTRTYMLRCVGNNCAAYQDGFCGKFKTDVIVPEEDE